jgi:hypothetical protein
MFLSVSAPNDDALLQGLIHMPRLSGEAPVFNMSDARRECPDTYHRHVIRPKPHDAVVDIEICP